MSKKSQGFKRLLTWLLATAMLLTSVPATAFATESPDGLPAASDIVAADQGEAPTNGGVAQAEEDRAGAAEVEAETAAPTDDNGGQAASGEDDEIVAADSPETERYDDGDTEAYTVTWPDHTIVDMTGAEGVSESEGMYTVSGNTNLIRVRLTPKEGYLIKDTSFAADNVTVEGGEPVSVSNIAYNSTDEILTVEFSDEINGNVIINADIARIPRVKINIKNGTLDTADTDNTTGIETEPMSGQADTYLFKTDEVRELSLAFSPNDGFRYMDIASLSIKTADGKSIQEYGVVENKPYYMVEGDKVRISLDEPEDISVSVTYTPAYTITINNADKLSYISAMTEPYTSETAVVDEETGRATVSAGSACTLYYEPKEGYVVTGITKASGTATLAKHTEEESVWYTLTGVKSNVVLTISTKTAPVYIEAVADEESGSDCFVGPAFTAGTDKAANKKIKDYGWTTGAAVKGQVYVKDARDALSNYDLSATYQLGDGSPVDLAVTAAGVFTIPQSVILSAESEGQSIEVTVKAVRKTVSLLYTGFATVNRYTTADGIGTEFVDNGATVDYNRDFYFQVTPYDRHIITAMTGISGIKQQVYKADQADRNGQTVSVNEVYYVIPAAQLKADRTFNIVTEAAPANVDASVSENYTDVIDSVTFTSGLKDGKTQHKALTGKVTMQSGEAIDNYNIYAVYQYGDDGEPVTVAADAKGVFTIPGDVVGIAEDFGYDINVSVYATWKTVRANFAGSNTWFLHVRYDQNGNIMKDIDPEQDGFGRQLSFDVPYNKDYQLIIIPEKHYQVSKITGYGGQVIKSKEQITNPDTGETYDVYTIKAANLKKEDTLVVYQEAVPASDELIVTLSENDLANSTVSIDRKYGTYENGELRLKKGTKEFELTVESKGEEHAYLWVDEVSGNDIKQIRNYGPSKKVFNKTGDGVVYTYTIASGMVADEDRIIDVYDEPVTDQRVYVRPDGLSSVLVKINGREIPQLGTVTDSDSGYYGYYEYDITGYKYENVVVEGIVADGYKLKEAKISNGITSSTSNTASVSAKIGQSNLSVRFTCSEVLTMLVDMDGEGQGSAQVYADKVTIKDVSQFADDINISFRYGGGNAAIESAIVSGSKDLGEHFATIGNDGTVTINATKAATAGTAPVKVTMTVNGETRTVSFIVNQAVTSVKVAGFAKDRSTGENTVKQVFGTEASYNLTLNKNADPGYLHAWASEGYDAAVSDDGKKVVIYTYNDEEGTVTLPGASGTIKLYYAEEEAEGEPADEAVLFTGTISEKDVKLAAPTVKVTRTTDAAMVLSLAQPTALKGYENLAYEITATSAGTVQGMKTTVADYVSGSETAYVLKLTDNGETGTGSATPVKYDISVKVVQLKAVDSTTFSNVINEDGIHREGTEKILKNQATKGKDTYETSLRLTGKKTQFIAGEKNFVIAMPVWSAATSVTEIDLDRSTLLGQYLSTLVTNNKIEIGTDGSIIVKDSSGFTVGKTTLTVYPQVPEKVEPKPASLAVTIKQPVTSIVIDAGTTRLLKADKKAASLAFKAVCYGDGTNKPAVSKVIWGIDEDSLPENLKGYVTITAQGKVTVNKDYVLSGDADKNKFKVTATANDYAGTEVTSAAVEIEITNEGLEFNSVGVGDITDFRSPIAPAVLVGSKLKINGEEVAYDAVSAEADLDNITIKSSSNDFVIGSDGTIKSISKKGIYTVTITANDGSKNRIVQKITVADSAPTYEVKATDVTDINGSAGEYDITGDKVISANAVTFTAKRTDSTLKNEGKFSVTGGTAVINTLTTDANGKGTITYIVKPNKAECKVTFELKDNAKTKYVITINSPAYDKKATVKATLPKNVYTHSEDINYTFAFKANETLPADTKLVFEADNAYYKLNNVLQSQSYMDLIKALNDAGIKLAAKGTDFSADVQLDGLTSGSYDINVYAVDSEGEPLTKPVKFTVKVSDAPKPSITIRNNNKLVLKEVGGNQNMAELKVTGMKNCLKVSIPTSDTGLGNFNNKGKINKFADYFSVAKIEEDKYYLEVVDSELTQDETTIQDVINGKTDNTGYIAVVLGGLDGKVYYQTIQLTVTKVE